MTKKKIAQLRCKMMKIRQRGNKTNTKRSETEEK